MGILKPQSSGSLYRNAVLQFFSHVSSNGHEPLTAGNRLSVIGSLAVDGWAVTFGTARRGLGGAAARPGPSLLYQM